MHRYICRIGPINLYAYGAMLALAFIAGSWFAARRARNRGIAGESIYDLVLYILVASLAGARLLYVAINFGYFKDHPVDILKLWEGGLVLYGGIAGGFCAAVYYLKKRKLPLWRVADILSPALALGIAIGRIGCFLNGCCYGRISSRWGVCFSSAGNPPVYDEQLQHGLITSAARCSLPVLPTQLYESAACLLIAGLLVFIDRRQRNFDGFLFWFFIALYSLERFFIEGIRYYEQNFFVGALTVSQLISIVFFALAAVVIAVNLNRCKKTIS
jgi:phosphatidylglycerol---prolipoprotein diacylglyceryl transferase